MTRKTDFEEQGGISSEKPLERNGVNRYKEQVGRIIKTVIGTPAQWLIDAAASVGLDLAGLTHEVTDGFITHAFKQHGDEKTERARGQIAVTLADIGRISDIVKTPDCAIIGIKRDGETLVAYAKKYENNTTIYYEEVLTGKKSRALRSKTIFIKAGDVSNKAFLNIAGSNAHIDTSGVKIVVGAGGHPDGGT